MKNTPLSKTHQQKNSTNPDFNISESPKILSNPRKGIKRFSIIPEEVKRRKDLSPTAKYVYGDLIKYAGNKDNAFPKRATIADSCGISIKMVDKAIKELKEANLICVKQRGLRKSNVYYFIQQDWQQTTPPPITEENSGVEVTPEIPKQVTPLIYPKDNCSFIHTAREEPKPVIRKSRQTQQHDIAQKMIEVWVRVVEEGGKTIELGDKLIRYLKQAIKDRFGGCLEKWRAYCERIASSKYLMGEKDIKGVWGKKWRASLDWCLKFANIDKVLSGKLYGFGDRVRKATVAELRREEEKIINEIKELPESEPIRKVRLNLVSRIGWAAYKSEFRDVAFEEKGDGWLDIQVKEWSNVIIKDFYGRKKRINSRVSDIDRKYGKEILKSIDGIFSRVSLWEEEIVDWEMEKKKRRQVNEENTMETVREAIQSLKDLCTPQWTPTAGKT